MQDKQKVQKISQGVYKTLKVLKIVFLVVAIVLMALAIVCAILGATGVFERVYDHYPKLGEIRVAEIFDDYDIDKFAGYTVKDVYDEGNLDLLSYIFAGLIFAEGVKVLVGFFILWYFIPTFEILSKSETPFTREISKRLKVTFILITILVLVEGALIGVLVGAILACLYYMYSYGCQLQENEDQTL